MASAEIPDLSRLQDVAAVNKALHDVLAQERSVQMELEQRLLRRKDMETELLSLTATVAEALQLSHSEAVQLADDVHATAAKAQEVSQRVRRLDTAQASVAAALEKVSLTLASTARVADVRAAMAAGDYEAAAGHITAYESLHVESDGAPAGDAQDAEGGAQKAVVDNARAQLLRVVREQVAAARSAGDTAAAARFLRLYKPLHVPGEGMAATLEFVRTGLRKAADEAYAAMDRAESGAAAGAAPPGSAASATAAPARGAAPQRVDYLGPLSATLKAAFVSVKSHAALVADAFGPLKVLELVVDVAKELDTTVPRVLQRFSRARQLSSLVASASGTDSSLSPVDPVAVDGLLSEMRPLLACAEELNSFLAATAADATKPRPLPQAFSDALRGGGYGAALRELQGGYVTLEGAYVEGSVAKALELDSVLPGALMTSALDDIFFVLHQATARAAATRSIHCFVSVVSLATATLSGPFRQALTRKLGGFAAATVDALAAGDRDDVASGRVAGRVPGPFGTPAGGSRAGSADVSVGRLEAAVAPFNNAARAPEYVAKTHEALEKTAAQRFTAPADAEAARAALDELHAATGALRDAALRAADTLAGALVLGPLRTPLATLDATSFQLSDAQYSRAEGEAGWAHALGAALAATLAALLPVLAPAAQAEAAAALVGRLAARVEAALAAKKFTGLGGLLLDRDIRTLVGATSDATGQPVRERFARLSQVVELLLLEAPAEAAAMWADEGITWRLSASDVRAVLSWRADFDRAAIASLGLP